MDAVLLLPCFGSLVAVLQTETLHRLYLHINDGLTVNYAFVTAIGFASVKSVYSYLGYYNVCHLGGEIINPSKNIPRSMFLSIAGITALYLLMNVSVVSVIPWQQAKESEFVLSVLYE